MTTAKTNATPGVCMYCGCDERHACELRTGEGTMPCSWADETRTVCTNPDCLVRHMLKDSPLMVPLTELKSMRCPCGARKRAWDSFCAKCYRALPVRIREGLYQSFLGGYVDTWKEARRVLAGIGRIREAA